MRILQVAPRYPPHTGGVETHVQELSERLVDRGHDVTVVTADAGADVDANETRTGVDVHRCRGVAPGGAFHLAPGVYRAVRTHEADVVHAHNYHALPMFFSTIGVTESRFVVTPHYHGKSSSGFREMLLTLYHPLGGWVLHQADAVIGVSEWERQMLREEFDIDSTLIPNGVDIDRFGDAPTIHRERPYLLSVGRLEEYKGVQYVIEALPELPTYDLLVAGAGPYQEALERKADRLGIRERVEFLGYVDEDQLPALYVGASVFLNLSTLEAYGMTVAESIAAGTPCVVRKAGALTEWTETPGVIGIEETNPTAVANAVGVARNCSVAKDDLISWDSVTDRIISVYQANG